MGAAHERKVLAFPPRAAAARERLRSAGKLTVLGAGGLCACSGRSSLHKDSAALPFIDEYELGEYERCRATHIPMSVNGAGLD